MNQIQAIKNEFERRMKATKDHQVFGALNELLSFIESLEKEQDVDLEKELEDWRHKHFKGKRDGDYSGEYLERESQLSIARHFYELELKAKENVPTIKGWVARDIHGTLRLYGNDAADGMGIRTGELPSPYKELTAKDDPIGVELTIHRV